MRIVISVKGNKEMDQYDIALAIRVALRHIEGGQKRGFVETEEGERIGVFHVYDETKPHTLSSSLVESEARGTLGPASKGK